MLESDLIGGSTVDAHAAALREGRLREIPLPRPVYRGRVGPVRLRARRLPQGAERLWGASVEALRRDVGLRDP